MSFSCLLAVMAVGGMILPAHGAVFCVRADGTRAFEWSCGAGDGPAATQADACGHGVSTTTGDQHAGLSMVGVDCFDIPVPAIAGVHNNARRETLRAAMLGSLQPLLYLDTVRRPRIVSGRCVVPTDGDRLLSPRHVGLLRTIILLI